MSAKRKPEGKRHKIDIDKIYDADIETKVNLILALVICNRDGAPNNIEIQEDYPIYNKLKDYLITM